MSYATDVLRRRQEMERAFRERYNPMEDVVSALSDIDKEAFRRQQLTAEEERAKAEEQRRVERFGLEKIQTEKETERLARQEQEAREDRAALAEERRARGKEWAAREAEVRQRTKQDEEAAARKAVVEKGYGMMRGAGLPGPGATPLSKSELEELGATVGMTADEVLAGIEQLESERSKLGAGLGLIEAKTEKEKAAAEAARRRGLPKPAKAVDTEVEDAKRRKIIAEAARAEAKRIRDEQIAKAGGFAVTKEYGDKLKDRRNSMTVRKTESARIRALVNKYPDLEKYVGSIDQYISEVRAKMGNQKAAEIIKALGTAFDNYRVAITGAAAGPGELEMLLKRVPNMGDSLGTILGKLTDDDEYFDLQFRVIDSQLQSGDMRAADAILGIGATPAAATAVATPAAVPKKAPSASVTAAAAEAGVELE